MNKKFLVMLDFLLWVTGSISIVYVGGMLLWIIGKVFYHTEITFYDIWLGVIAIISFILLFLLKKRSKKE